MPGVAVDLAFARREVRRAAVRRDVIVVIDVLRATSTIITALSNGAKKVVPAQTPEQARNLWRENPGSLLAGERGGERPDGFNLGNSPREFHPEVVKGRTIILTTSSGTKTILAVEKAPHVLLGAFLNVRAVGESARDTARAEGRGIALACSGSKHLFSLEDFLCAGAIASRLHEAGEELSDFAWGAVLAFENLTEPLDQAIWKCLHARELKAQGLAEDVEFCSRVDHYQMVPALTPEGILPT